MRFVAYTNESAIARPANREKFSFRMEENYSLRMVYALQWTSAKKHRADLTAEGPKTHIVLLLFQYRTPVLSRKIRKPCYILEVFKIGKNTNVNSTPGILCNS